MGAPLWEPSQALRVSEVLECSTYPGGGGSIHNDLGVW